MPAKQSPLRRKPQSAVARDRAPQGMLDHYLELESRVHELKSRCEELEEENRELRSGAQQTSAPQLSEELEALVQPLQNQCDELAQRNREIQSRCEELEKAHQELRSEAESTGFGSVEQQRNMIAKATRQDQRQYAESIVIEGANLPERLLDEVLVLQ